MPVLLAASSLDPTGQKISDVMNLSHTWKSKCSEMLVSLLSI